MVKEIDSSRGEGGGQMVRTSVALATLTHTVTRLTRIRENRPTNGLSKQHTTAVAAIAKMTGSKITGNQIGSSELLVEPGNDRVPDIALDIGTAGSISLVVQATLLAARDYETPFNLDLRGGTNVMWAPPIDSYNMVLFPLMKRMGIDAHAEIIERGFYPIGGGHVKVTQEPIGTIKPLDLDHLGELKGIRGLCFVQHLSDRIGQDMMDACRRVFEPEYPIEIEYQKCEGTSRGAGMVLVAEYENGLLSSNVLSSKGHSAHQSGLDAASDLLQEMRTGSTVDIHTADQLLPYMAMADGKSEFIVSRISKHLLSQMDTLESFLDVRFGVERKDDGYHFTVTPGANGI
ncbi:RNA 3'-phosphate cyclase [Thermoplasmatales archaeon BRNA1]|nr:RNA 3'-phosphate cyclase [Thermoplasmatales archaeon BRNA1]